MCNLERDTWMGFWLSRFVYESFLRVCFFQEGVSRGFVICSKGSVSSLPDLEETFTDPNIKTHTMEFSFPLPMMYFLTRPRGGSINTSLQLSHFPDQTELSRVKCKNVKACPQPCFGLDRLWGYVPSNHLKIFLEEWTEME